MRALIERGLEVLEKEVRGDKPPKIVLEAPTAYGKSTAAPLISRILIESGWCYNFIHSLPLRAIVEDLYLCLLINSLTSDAGLRDRCKKKEAVLQEVKDALMKAGIDADSVAYQMGETILVDEKDEERRKEITSKIRKEPLFNARYVVTTLDSLAYNTFRVPVTEIFDARKHYAIPRARIYTSAVYFDEAHMIYEEGEDEESTMFTAFNEMLKILNVAYVPLVVASATLSKSSEEHVCGTLSNCKIIKLGKEPRENDNCIVVQDKEFENCVKSIDWITEFLEEERLAEKVKELLESGLKVFVARDTIGDAIRTYDEVRETASLKDDDIVLLHSLMTKEDRNEALKKIRSARVLVATSVVEAGVDISFDSLVTDGGRPPSIIQRTGRICRELDKCKDRRARIYILKNNHLNESVKKFIELKGNKRVCWRLPYETNEYMGYEKLLSIHDFHKISKELEGRPELSRGNFNEMFKRKINKELERSLKALVSPLLISSGSIKGILRKHNYELVRTFLAEVFVSDPNVTSGLNLNKVGFVVSLSKLEMLASKGCVNGLYVVLGERGNAEVKKIRDLNELTARRGGIDLSKYFETIEELIRDRNMRYRVSGTAFLLSRKCYEDGRGVKL
jgi:CRISPR-associated endonuclease/helicase Cas3